MLPYQFNEIYFRVTGEYEYLSKKCSINEQNKLKLRNISYMEKSIAATFYPKQIIIATRVSNEHGSIWTMTDCLSILSHQVSNEELGMAVIRHMVLSTVKSISGSESMDLRRNYKRLCKFKTEGEVMKESRLVSVFLTDQDVRFEPKNNRYSQVKQRHYEYQGIPDAIFTIDYPCAPEIIGTNLRKAWLMATIT